MHGPAALARARQYDPATGQFLTRDPLEATTRDPYGYAGGNPINRIDPSGLNWLSDRASDVGGAIAGGVDAAWDNTGGRAVSTVADVAGGAVSYAYEHSTGLSQIAGGLSILAYAACPLTAGATCALGSGLAYASAGLATMSAWRECNGHGVISADCGLAVADAALAATGAALPNRFALTGRHFANALRWRSQAVFNLGIGGVANLTSRMLHTLAGDDFLTGGADVC